MQVLIKFESYNPIKKDLIISLARQINLPIKSYINLKKKNKILVTVISGPHVHKKSREQYKIDYYQSLLLLELDKDFSTLHNDSLNSKFLYFKHQIYEKALDKGLEITYTYKKKEKLAFANLLKI